METSSEPSQDDDITNQPTNPSSLAKNLSGRKELDFHLIYWKWKLAPCKIAIEGNNNDR
jgi:hypothetical protein